MSELKLIKSPEGQFNFLKIWESTQFEGRGDYSFSLMLRFAPNQDLSAFIAEIEEQKKIALKNALDAKRLTKEIVASWQMRDILNYGNVLIDNAKTLNKENCVYDHFENCYYMSSSTKDETKKTEVELDGRKAFAPPGVFTITVDQFTGDTVRSKLVRGNPLDEAQIYSGCKGKISFKIFAWSNKSSKAWGYSAGLQNILKTADGERLGGGSNSGSEFDDEAPF